MQIELNPWWVTGLVDGEGCFLAQLSFRMRAGRRGSYTRVDLTSKFSIALRADEQLQEMCSGLADSRAYASHGVH